MARGAGPNPGNGNGSQGVRRVTVEYSVPVLCQVDLATGEVERVKVLDEEVSSPGAVYTSDGHAPEAVSQRAREIASEQPWPAWEFGY